MGFFKRTLTKEQKNGDLFQRISAVAEQVEKMSNQPQVDMFTVRDLFREVEKLEKDYLYDDDIMFPKGIILAEKGKLWAFKGDTDKALSLLTQAINLDVNNSTARIFKAYLLINQDNKKGALNEAEAALKDRKKELETQAALAGAGILQAASEVDEETEEIKALIRSLKGGAGSDDKTIRQSVGAMASDNGFLKVSFTGDAERDAELLFSLTRKTSELKGQQRETYTRLVPEAVWTAMLNDATNVAASSTGKLNLSNEEIRNHLMQLLVTMQIQGFWVWLTELTNDDNFPKIREAIGKSGTITDDKLRKSRDKVAKRMREVMTAKSFLAMIRYTDYMMDEMNKAGLAGFAGLNEQQLKSLNEAMIGCISRGYITGFAAAHYGYGIK